MKRYTVTKPSVWMYKTEDLCGEVSDELLFGTVLEIISENDTTVLCRTDYGYTGYINKWELYECENDDCKNGEIQFVNSRCDLLVEPRYYLAPHMSLPKGARIKILGEYDNRFSACELGRRVMYIPNFALKKEVYSDFADAFVKTALSYIGTPYRWGGKSDTGIDCSGLVFMSARLCGFEIFRDSVPCDKYVDIIDGSDVLKGDIAYFKGHVAIMISKERFVHSSASCGMVVVSTFEDSVPSEKDVVCYARIKNRTKK